MIFVTLFGFNEMTTDSRRMFYNYFSVSVFPLPLLYARTEQLYDGGLRGPALKVHYQIQYYIKCPKP